MLPRLLYKVIYPHSKGHVFDRKIEVFAAVQNSQVLYGVVPFENSSNGSVLYTLDLLIDREQKYSDVVVCGEAYLPVHHCLLGHIDPQTSNEETPFPGSDASTTRNPDLSMFRAYPLTNLSSVTRILSHPQAFGQCEKFLSKYLKGIEWQEVSSTSKAAEIVAADKSNTSAAISSRLAAEIYDLDFLADGIQDREDNTTRFFILRRGLIPGIEIAFHRRPVPEVASSKWKTMVSFGVDHYASGALADALQVFKTFDLNLTSISSRPSRVRLWHYIFLVEMEGKKDIDGKGQVNHALHELGKSASGWRWLGSWVNRMSAPEDHEGAI